MRASNSARSRRALGVLGGIASWRRCGRGLGCRPRQGSQLRTLGRVGCHYVESRGRDQHGQTLDHFQGREPQRGAPIGLGPLEAIDELVMDELLDPLQGEGWAGAIAQRPLQPGAVGAVGLGSSSSGQERFAPSLAPILSRLPSTRLRQAPTRCRGRVRAARHHTVVRPLTPCSRSSAVTRLFPWTSAVLPMIRSAGSP